MGISNNYFYELFERSYAEAGAAKQRGNLAVAKVKYAEAAGYLESHAKYLTGEEAKKTRVRAERLRSISDAIVVLPPRRASKATPRAAAADRTDPLADDEMGAFISFFDPKDINIGFDDVIGLEKAKETVVEYVINPIKYPEHYNYDFNNNKAVLLHGPPGTGKTTFAKAVARELGQPFVLVNVAALVNCLVGETGKNIDKVFDWLRGYVERHNTGITVFFDELDEIAKKRGGDDKSSAAAVPALLRNLDGLKQNKSFLVLANTNLLESLDGGILDRFRQRIFIPLPDCEMRATLFKSKLKDVEPEFMAKLDIPALAMASEGLSGRTITYICDDFKYYVGGVKAGIKDGSDLNGVMLSYISERARVD